jgi:hypothetical protein
MERLLMAFFTISAKLHAQSAFGTRFLPPPNSQDVACVHPSVTIPRNYSDRRPRGSFLKAED